MSSFNAVKEIVKMLESENLVEYAKNIDNALSGGATSSEIWGGVRFYLLQVPTHLISVSAKNKIKDLIKEIDKTLN